MIGNNNQGSISFPSKQQRDLKVSAKIESAKLTSYTNSSKGHDVFCCPLRFITSKLNDVKSYPSHQFICDVADTKFIKTKLQRAFFV